jgi:hypothetical protein
VKQPSVIAAIPAVISAMVPECPLTLAVELFNRPSRTAREQSVLILTAHAFEMLLKAIIYQDRARLSDRGDTQNYSFVRCINISNSELQAVTSDERVLLLAVKQDRDQAAHDVVHMGEDIFYLHVRSARYNI